MRQARQAESRVASSRENETDRIPHVIRLYSGGQGFPEIPVGPGMRLVWLRAPTANIQDASALQSMLFNPEARVTTIPPSRVPHMGHLHSQNVSVKGDVIQYKDCIACEQPIAVYEAIMRGELEKAEDQIKGIARRGSPNKALSIHFSQRAIAGADEDQILSATPDKDPNLLFPE